MAIGRIQRVDVLRFVRTLDGTAWNPAARWHERQAALVLIETEDGVLGVGEAWTGYLGADAVLDVLAHEVAPALLGRRVEHPTDLMPDWPQGMALGISPLHCRNLLPLTRERAAAWSAVDLALWDAWGRQQNLPVWRLLGGADGMAPVYASGGLYRDGQTPETLAQEAAGYRERGFLSMKMKVAGVPLSDDLLRIAAVRQAMGAEACLWVDAVNQLTPESALAFWHQLAPYRAAAIQSPLAAADVAGMRALNGAGVPVIASEAEYRPDVLCMLMHQGAVSYLQFCLPLCGGFSGGLLLDAAAQSVGVRTTPQCFSTVVAQAATLQFTAACPNVISAEYHCFHDHLHGLFLGHAGSVVAGQACAGDEPGLSIGIPEPGCQPDGSVLTLFSSAR